jgi:hypothetical protein
VVASRSILLTFSIITTNINKTAIAPTYIIKKTKPIKSACRNVNNNEEKKNRKMKKITEWIGLRHKTISNADDITQLYIMNKQPTLIVLRYIDKLVRIQNSIRIFK